MVNVRFYTAQFAALDPRMGGLVLAVTFAAFAGSFVGAQLLKKVTLHTVQLVIGVLLIGLGVGMTLGLL